MNRDDMIDRLGDGAVWDILIIGGGATGLGCAIDAAARGYRTLLVERGDFAKGTSSRSTKLVHGGVRYLQQGNFSLVLEALKERGLLRRNAPHLVHDLPFVVPNYDWWEAPFYGFGLKLYDIMAGKLGFGKSRLLSREETVERIPTIETDGLRGGVIYHDGQFDDARLAINLAQTAVEHGAVVANYVEVTSLLKDGDVVSGVVARDAESGEEYQLRAKIVINATGAFSDAVRRMDETDAAPMIRPSQGVHLVLDRAFLPGDSAIMVPHTSDGRVIFVIPWHDRVVIGTTDTPIEKVVPEPTPMREEIDFLLTYAARYLTKDPTPADVLSVFAGIRPLVSAGDDKNTAAISRDHTIHISRGGLLTVAGGKWTTYRKMAEDTIDHAMELAELEPAPCPTCDLHIHGHDEHPEAHGDLDVYGSDAPRIRELNQPALLHADLPVIEAQVLWAARREMARTVEDVLARRTRSLLLNARASIAAAPRVAELLAAELGRDAAWQKRQIEAYTDLAEGYRLA